MTRNSPTGGNVQKIDPTLTNSKNGQKMNGDKKGMNENSKVTKRQTTNKHILKGMLNVDEKNWRWVILDVRSNGMECCCFF